MTFEEWVEDQERDVFLDYSSAEVGWYAAMQVKNRDWLMDYIKHLDQEIARKKAL